MIRVSRSSLQILSACEAKEGPSGAGTQLVEQVVELGAKGGGEAERCGSLRQPVLEDVPVQHTRHVRRTGPREGSSPSPFVPVRAQQVKKFTFFNRTKKSETAYSYCTSVHLDLVSSTCSYCKLYPGVLIKLFNLCTRKRIYEYAQIYYGIFCGSLPKHSSFKITQKKKSWSRGVA